MSSYVGSEHSSYPYSAVTYIEATFASGETYSGSGAVVGENDVLTASHLVYSSDEGGVAEDIDVYPARDGSDTPFDSYEAESVDYFEVDPDGDGKITKSNSENDFALLGFDQTLDEDIGEFALEADSVSGNYNLTGYPKKYADETGPRMTNDNGYVTKEKFSSIYDIDALESNPGNSGGPLWHAEDDRASIAGVLSTEAWAASMDSHYWEILGWMEDNNSLIEGNNPPECRDDRADTDVDKPLTIDVLANDSDPDGDSLKIVSVEKVKDASISITEEDKIYIDPDSGFTGEIGFTYTVSDGNGGNNSAEVKLSVNNKEVSRGNIGLYRPDHGDFNLNLGTDGDFVDKIIGYGLAGKDWMPITGDFDGNSSFGLGLYNRAEGKFYLDFDMGGELTHTFRFGPHNNDWLPLANDFNADGSSEVGLYDQENGTFYFDFDTYGGRADKILGYGPGGENWMPVAGDFDGDSRNDIGLYNQTNAKFYLDFDMDGGRADYTSSFGPPNNDWLPLANDINKDGVSDLGLYDQENGTFYFDYANDGGIADETIEFGTANNNWLPLSNLPAESHSLSVLGGSDFQNHINDTEQQN